MSRRLCPLSQFPQPPFCSQICQEARVIELRRNNLFVHPRRNQNCWNSDTILSKSVFSCLVIRRDSCRWHDVIIKSTVLIVEENEKRTVPKVFVSSQGVVHLSQ